MGMKNITYKRDDFDRWEGVCQTHGCSWTADEKVGCPDCQDAEKVTCAWRSKHKRIHVIIPVGIRANKCGVCGGTLPAKKLPNCKACVMGMMYLPERFKELGHELRTEEHPIVRPPKMKSS